MTPCVYQLQSVQGVKKGTEGALLKPDLRYLHAFNVAGGRPGERLGSRGSFTPGVRIMSGGQARDIPLSSSVNPGTVLFESSALKPDKTGEAHTNVVGGRPMERLGSRGSFTPGQRVFRGGLPRDVALAPQIDPGKVTHVSAILKPDLSGQPIVNASRPGERFGTRGSFSPGVPIMAGGHARDVAPEPEIDHGTVLSYAPHLKPDLSGEARMNVAGGRPTERLGSRGSFTPGNKTLRGGAARDVPLLPDTHSGDVLFVFPTLKPDLSGEARTNATRPDERLGTKGRFTPGVIRWRGGEPRDLPVDRKMEDTLSPSSLPAASTSSNDAGSFRMGVVQDDAYGGFVETETVTGCQMYDTVPEEDQAAFEKADAGIARENSGVFRRCGSDSEFATMEDITQTVRRPAF